MSTRIDSIFTKYEFTEEEYLAACVFTDLQRQHIQNEMTIAAETLVQLQYDPLNRELVALQNAYYRGQVDMAKFLLGISADRKSDLQASLEASAKKQQSE